MPWQTIFKTLSASDGGVLDGLGRAIRSALGLGSGNGVDRAAFTAAVVALSAKLAKSDGVLCPPSGIDPQMHAPAPNVGTMPVIPPPGSPGGDPTVRPK